MFPSSQTISVEKPTTLREFIAGLGVDVLYAYDRRVLVALVNGENKWPSVELRRGDRVTLMPIITGG